MGWIPGLVNVRGQSYSKFILMTEAVLLLDFTSSLLRQWLVFRYIFPANQTTVLLPGALT
jgi:hypothetical protein